MLKFSISRQNALKCLTHVVGSTDKKDSISDILSCVKIDIANNIATFTATNLDMQSSDNAEITMDSESDKVFSFVVPIHQVLEIVKRLPDKADISMLIENAIDGMLLKLSSGKFKFSISLYADAKDFPQMSVVEKDKEIKVKSENFERAVKKSYFAMSNEDNRVNLSGLMIHTENSKLNFVATDGHRLSLSISDAEFSNNLENSIIPRKAVYEILKLIAGFDGDVMLNFGNGKVAMNIGSTTFTTKLVDASFPDYKRVIPTDPAKILSLNSAEFVKGVNLVACAGVEKDNKSLTFNISKDGVEISNKTDMYVASEVMQDIEYNADDVTTVKYNYKFITDVLNEINGKCVMKFSSADAPVLIQQEGDNSSSYIIMPMKS